MKQLDYQGNAGRKLIEKDVSFWFNDQEVYQYDENRLSELGWKILS